MTPHWRLRTGICLLGLLWSVAVQAAHLTLTFEADDWMPFNGDGINHNGYAIDVLKAIFEPKGIAIVFRSTPWARAIGDARTGKCDGVIGAQRSEIAGFVIPQEELGQGRQAFYVRKDSAWRFQSTDSLKQVTLAVIKDYSYSQAINQYVRDHRDRVYVGVGEQPLQHNLQMLIHRRVDAVVDDETVMQYAIHRAGLTQQVVLAGYDTGTEKNYIAFSPANPASVTYASMLDEGMRRLRKNGQLRRILARYGLSDWK
ncbi:ABC transporter substrate-binding protein [Paludibacterium sp. B53371]|uniref:substrate-binding periplasmic protein n=1 Tax=Paludibacterium sp. B53371 TaxID=2806263 RepID=UPI001C044EF8|nr:transporter substrate-binding domain-containing protein [Paludibacterium sp. B53371]